jgi:hypothetical protein
MISQEILLYQRTKDVSIVNVQHNLHVSNMDVVTAVTGRVRKLPGALDIISP